MSQAHLGKTWWPSLIARGVIALAVGLLITFSADHSALYGLVIFTVFAIATALTVGVGALALHDRALRTVSMVQAAAGAVIGIFVAIEAALLPHMHTGILLAGLGAWAGITGALEVYLGVRGRAHSVPMVRDWFTIGALTAVFAIIVVLVPVDFEQPWAATGKDAGISGVLTADIITVGAFGAYAVVIGVLLVIGAFSGIFRERDDQRATVVTDASTSTNGAKP